VLTATRCIAASLALHASLICFASDDSVPRRVPRTETALHPLEGAISLEAASAGAEGASEPRSSERVQPPAPADEPSAAPQRAPRTARVTRPRAPPAPVTAATRALPEPLAALSSDPAVPVLVPDPAATPSPGLADPAQPPGPPAADVRPIAGAAAGSPGSPPAGAGGPVGGSSALGAGEGRGGPSGAARGLLLRRYLDGVRERVARHREYPYLARRANLEGTICLRVSIGASGQVLAVTPTCGNENLPLLGAALKSVSRAAPFPPLPPALGRELALDLPIVFDLDNM
jgi:protein TonB